MRRSLIGVPRGWESVMYVVRALVGEKSLAGKITVK